MRLEKKVVKLDEFNVFEQMWEQVKQAMVNSATLVCGFVKVGRKNMTVEEYVLHGRKCWEKRIIL